jgi:putative methyltransferase (TIGR04325 family)
LQATGYDSASVAEVATKSLTNFVQNFSIPELLDSRIQQMHSVFTTIPNAGKRALRVLDVGGAAGVYYFYLKALSPLLDLDWTVLELPSVAAACRAVEDCPG